jgi:SAM-dependent methyltransferase
MNNDFNDLKKTWNHYGQTEPYWSVLTHEKYKNKNLTKDTLDDYFDSGKYHINLLEELLQLHKSSFKDKIVLDFGCGTGRLLKWCSIVAKKIYGYDISKEHLNIAKQNVPESELYCIEDTESLPSISTKIDIIYSLLVFQHNRPPMIKKYITLLLELLNTNGIAVFHIPYYIPNYEYRQENWQGKNIMEMHALKKKEVIYLSNKLNCEILSIYNVNYCSKDIKDAIYIIRKLPLDKV